MFYSDKLTNIFPNDCQIIGKEKYLNTAVLVPILNINNTEYLLFEKRSANVRQPGEISFPGGHIDLKLDIDSRSAAVRETSEELGIKTDKIKVIGKLGTLVTPLSVLVETFVGYLNINNIDELKIDSKEVDRIFIIPLNYFVKNDPEEYNTRIELHPYRLDENGNKHELLPVKELGLPSKYSNSYTKGKHRVLVYRTSEEIIWGITAEIIFDLSKKLRS